MHDVVAHLRARGRHHLAHLAGPDDAPGGRLRRRAFIEALGGDFDARLVETGDYTRASGAAAMERLLDRGTPLDAVFAASDAMAAGAVSVLARRGLSVPRDVSVVGFDDSGLAEAHEPALSTVRQPWDALSQAMAEAVLDRVAGGAPRVVRLPAELVVRQSS